MSSVWRPGEPLGPLRELVERGGVLAIPTESSYGLAVDPENREAVNAVFAIKHRPADKPLPVVVAKMEQIYALGAHLVEPLSAELERLWPAPLSVLLPVEGDAPAAAGTGRLAFRIPEHAVLRELLEGLGRGLSATSANRSGEPPILDLAELEDLLAGADAMIVDGGVLGGGPPSTLVEWREGIPHVLREGAFPVDQLISFSASSVEISVEDAPRGAR